MPYPDNAMNDMLERQALIDKINNLQDKLDGAIIIIRGLKDDNERMQQLLDILDPDRDEYRNPIL